MKFKGPLSFEARETLRSQWNPWFAWRPVRVGVDEFRWLEKVERRRIMDWFGGQWEYRVILRP